MGFTSGSARQVFPFGADAVFEGLLAILPENGFSIRGGDRLIKRIEAATGPSMFSWGENLALVVVPLEEGQSAVEIDGALKFGISGANRHHKNFQTIIMALSRHLQRRQ